MPMVYAVVPGALQTTNATPNTENDAFYIAAGTGRGVGLISILCHGKGAALTAISGITLRLKKWTTTASSAGTSITPTPKDPGMQASKHTAGYSVTTVTSGTGGPTLLGSIGMGAAGPGGWTAPIPDAVPYLESASADSFDLFNTSGTASLNFEVQAETQE